MYVYYSKSPNVRLLYFLGYSYQFLFLIAFERSIDLKYVLCVSNYVTYLKIFKLNLNNIHNMCAVRRLVTLDFVIKLTEDLLLSTSISVEPLFVGFV